MIKNGSIPITNIKLLTYFGLDGRVSYSFMNLVGSKVIDPYQDESCVACNDADNVSCEDFFTIDPDFDAYTAFTCYFMSFSDSC